MRTNPRGESAGAEPANHHPQLERPKASAELNTVIHEIDDRFALRRNEIFVHQGERALEHIWPGREKGRAVEWREEPLVRIDDKGVGVVDAGEDVSHLRHDGGDSAVRSIDVEPHSLAPTDLG